MSQEMGLTVSLSTVYRTLHALTSHGNLTTLKGERGRHYETSRGEEHHDHLICLRCGLTIEFTDDLIDGFGEALAQRKGFEHTSSRFDILGICNQCFTKDESHRTDQALECVNSALSSTLEAASLIEQAKDCLHIRKSAQGLKQGELAHNRLIDAVKTLNKLFSLFDPLATSGDS